MELAHTGVMVAEHAANEPIEIGPSELDDLQLALVGGGMGETINA